MSQSGSTPNLSPTFAEMAERMKSKARSVRYSASKDYTGEERQALLGSAERFDRIAASMIEKQVEAMHARDGMLEEYRKARANRTAVVTYDTRLDPISPNFDIRTWTEELPNNG